MSIHYLVNGVLLINVGTSNTVGFVEQYCIEDMETLLFGGYVFWA